MVGSWAQGLLEVSGLAQDFTGFGVLGRACSGSTALGPVFFLSFLFLLAELCVGALLSPKLLML